MMNLNMMELMQAVFSNTVVKQASERFQLEPDAIQKVIGAATPTLLASLMNKSATPEGGRALFETLMSSQVDADIAQKLPAVLTDKLQTNRVIETGRDLFHGLTSNCLPILGSEIARQTGVGERLALSVTGLVGATLLGTLKNHLMQNQGRLEQLPTLLEQQLPSVVPHLDNNVVSVLGIGGIKSFVDRISTQLKNTSSSLLRSEQPIPLPINTSRDVSAPHASASSAAWWRRSGWLVLLALVLVLALLFLRSCQKPGSVAPSQVASQPAITGAASLSETLSAKHIRPAQMNVQANASGRPDITAAVGSEAEKQTILDALKEQFGADHFTANITVDPAIQPAPWLAHLNELVPLMASVDAKLEVDGHTILVGSPSASTTQDWIARLTDTMGPDFKISALGSLDSVTVPVSFEHAISNLKRATGACVAQDVVDALNLQTIQFGSNADRPVAPEAMDRLRISAQALASCTPPVALEVRGYSDNLGSREGNLRLAKLRAEFVRRVLIEQGAAADSLVAVGLGAVDPVASNATESGRLANRRVVFAVHTR
ncbi:OmpA family protein [Burkholderia pyrrocinia]